MKIINFHDFPSNSEFPKTMAKCALSWPGNIKKTMLPNEMLDRIRVWLIRVGGGGVDKQTQSQPNQTKQKQTHSRS